MTWAANDPWCIAWLHGARWALTLRQRAGHCVSLRLRKFTGAINECQKAVQS